MNTDYRNDMDGPALEDRRRPVLHPHGCGLLVNRCLGSDRFLEGDSLRHIGGMLVPQMTIGSHGQRAAVFMSQPPGDRRNVNARFDTSRGKEVTQIVVSNPRHSDDLGRPVHGLLAFTNAHDRYIIRFIGPLLAKAFHEAQAYQGSWELPALHLPPGPSARFPHRPAQ